MLFETPGKSSISELDRGQEGVQTAFDHVGTAMKLFAVWNPMGFMIFAGKRNVAYHNAFEICGHPLTAVCPRGNRNCTRGATLPGGDSFHKPI